MLNDIDLKLLVGKPIDIPVGKVYPLTINDIVEIGDNKYNQYLNLLLFDVNDIEINENQLKEMGIDKLTTYQFLLLQAYNSEEFKELITEVLKCFLRETVEFDHEYFLFKIKKDQNEFAYIDLNTFDLIKKILIKQNYLKELEEEENIVFGNELAKKWYYDLKKKERTQLKPKSNVDLQSIISAVMWRTSKPIDEILKMTIYQLYDGFYRLSLIDSCNNLAQGIYHGIIDQKSIKDNDLNWAKVIKINN